MILEFKPKEGNSTAYLVKTDSGLFLSFNENEATEITQQEAELIIQHPSFGLAGASDGVIITSDSILSYRIREVGDTSGEFILL